VEHQADNAKERFPADGAGAVAGIVRQLGRDTRWYLPAAIVPAAASLAGIAVFTRLFDAGDYGRYALVMATVTILSAVLGGWVQQSTLRYLPRFEAEGRLDEFKPRVSGLLAVVCFGAGLLLFLVYHPARTALGGLAPLYLPALALLLAEVLFLGLSTVYQAELRSRQFAWFKMTSAVLRFAFALAFVLFVRRDVVGLIIGAVLSRVIVIAPMGREVSGPRGGIRFDPALVKLFVAYGLPMVGWTFCSQILDLSDRYVIGAFRGQSEVGVYSANYALVRMGFGLLSGPLLMAAHPLIINAYERTGEREMPGTVRTFSRYFVVAAVPLVTLVSVFGREIVGLLLGAEFREGYTIIPFVLGGAMLWGLSMFAHKGLEIRERTGLMLSLVVVCAVVNLALNFVFVPRYGYVAAAATTFVTYFVYLLLVLLIDRSNLRWRVPWPAITRSLVAAGVTAALIGFLKRLVPPEVNAVVVLVVGGALGTALYALLLVLLGEFRRAELLALMGRRN
jgi:O-antigen/teichoic acid export membrane protein